MLVFLLVLAGDLPPIPLPVSMLQPLLDAGLIEVCEHCGHAHPIREGNGIEYDPDVWVERFDTVLASLNN